MLGGRVSKAGKSVDLTTIAIKQHLGIPLTPEEQRTELTVSTSRSKTKKRVHGKQASN